MPDQPSADEDAGEKYGNRTCGKPCERGSPPYMHGFSRKGRRRFKFESRIGNVVQPFPGILL
jgi:hypothetical protein